MKLNMKNNFLFIFASILCLFTLISCSFIEKLPGEHQIIYANDTKSCEEIKRLTFSVRTEMMFISRSEKAIAEELQTLAQNEAIKLFANAIWRDSDIKDGQQSFLILRCNNSKY